MVLRLNYGLGYTETQQDITGATTILPPAETLPGRNVVYLLDQDGTGSHNIDFDAAFNFPDGFTQPITDLADKRRVLQFVTTSGGTLVYNQDYTTDVPNFVPEDYLSFWDFNGDGVDAAGYWQDFLASGTGCSFGAFSVSATGLLHTGATLGFEQRGTAGPQTAPSVDRTFVGWMEGNCDVSIIFDNGSFASGSSSVTLSPSASTIRFNSYWYDFSSFSSSSSSAYFSSPGLASGVHHIAVVATNVGKTFYRNGVELGTVLQPRALNGMSGYPGAGTDNTFRIRMNDTSAIDELRVYNRVLTPVEITALFDLNKADYGF